MDPIMMPGMDLLARQLVAALRAHLAGGRPVPLEGSMVLWNAFGDLSATRTWHAAGPNPISFTEIEAYSRLMLLPLEPRHVATIRAMDAAWIDHRRGQTTDRPKPSGKITPAAFDAVFQ